MSSCLAADPAFLSAVLEGLRGCPRTLPCRYFYDDAGSRLFEEICDLPEYYLTRAEDEILQEHGREIAAAVGSGLSTPGAELVELGSGSSRKTRRLLSVLLERQSALRYVPVDISRAMLHDTADALALEFPRLEVAPLAAEYGPALRHLRVAGERPRLVLFLGSNLGNFTPDEARAFVTEIRSICGGGGLLIGLDLVKDPAVLNAAYDDARGITAQFNLNLLRRLNRELGAEFHLPYWSHRAFFNDAAGRVEMHLVSMREQSVRVGGVEFHFRAGETVHTENSYKFTPAGIRELAAASGFDVARTWMDRRQWFALSLFTPLPNG